MNHSFKKLGTLILGLALSIGVAYGVSAGNHVGKVVYAAENDTHDYSQSISQLLNNSASIPSVTINDPGYPIKSVIVSSSYNKDISNPVTASVTIGGVGFDSSKTITGKTSHTTTFTGSALSGKVVVSFTNNTGSGTGHGTFSVSNVRLVEGSSKTLSSIAVTTPPTKTDYVETQTFDPTGMVVTATYDDASTAPVDGYTITPSTPLTYGTDSVTISYGGKTTTQAITVAHRTLSSISIKTNPIRTSYYLDGVKTFDSTGLVITAKYIEDVNDVDLDSGFTTDYDGKTFVEGDIAAEIPVTVSYTENAVTKSVSFNISVARYAPGGVNDPFTCAELVAASTNTTYYVTGYVSNVDTSSSKYGVYLSDTFKTSNHNDKPVYLFKPDGYAYGAIAENFPAGSLVVAHGTHILYSSQHELDSGCIIDSITKPSVSSLTVSGAKTEFTAGDTFVKGGDFSAFADFNIQSDVDVSSSVSFTLGGDPLTVGSTKIRNEDDGQTVTVSYTYGAVTVSDTYELDVTPKAVQSVTLSPKSQMLYKGESVQLTATIADEYHDPAVVITWESSDTDVATVSSTGLVSAGTKSGTATITASAGGKSDTATITVNVDYLITLDKSSIDDLYTGDDPQTITVTNIKNFNGEATFEWSSSNTDVVTVSGDTSSATISVVGAGEATITFAGKEGGAIKKSVTCDVTVTLKTVSSVTWTGASDIDVFEGATLSEIPGTISASWNNGDNEANVDKASCLVKLDDSTIALPHTWMPEDSGKELSISYGGVKSNAVDVTVTDALNSINGTYESSGSYSFTASSDIKDSISDTGSFTSGGVTWTVTRDSSVYLGYTSSCLQFGSGSGAESVTLSTSGISGTISKVIVECSSYNGAHTLSISVGESSYASSVATSSWTSITKKNGTGSASGAISITLTKGTRAVYIKSVEIQYAQSIEGELANKNLAAQKLVLQFANYMNEQMNGTNVCSGTKENLTTAWSNVSSKYTELFSGSSETVSYAKALLKYATAKWDDSPDVLQQAMKTYEFCVANHSMSAFMSALRTPAAPSMSVVYNLDFNASAIIIVIISALSIASVGGFFMFRRRKETN